MEKQVSHNFLFSLKSYQWMGNERNKALQCGVCLRYTIEVKSSIDSLDKFLAYDWLYKSIIIVSYYEDEALTMEKTIFIVLWAAVSFLRSVETNSEWTSTKSHPFYIPDTIWIREKLESR